MDVLDCLCGKQKVAFLNTSAVARDAKLFDQPKTTQARVRPARMHAPSTKSQRLQPESYVELLISRKKLERVRGRAAEFALRDQDSGEIYSVSSTKLFPPLPEGPLPKKVRRGLPPLEIDPL